MSCSGRTFRSSRRAEPPPSRARRRCSAKPISGQSSATTRYASCPSTGADRRACAPASSSPPCFVVKPLAQYTEADHATVLGVNLTGFFHITQLAIAWRESREVSRGLLTTSDVSSEHRSAIAASLSQAPWTFPADWLGAPP